MRGLKDFKMENICENSPKYDLPDSLNISLENKKDFKMENNCENSPKYDLPDSLNISLENKKDFKMENNCENFPTFDVNNSLNISLENKCENLCSSKLFYSLDSSIETSINKQTENDKEQSHLSESQLYDYYMTRLESKTINSNNYLQSKLPILSLAPMLKVTTPNFRKLLSIISPTAILFTEMIVDNTIINNDNDYILNKIGLPTTNTVVQLGGSDPQKIILAVQKLKLLGFKNFNLNCGCPSTKVKKGCFGAILMKNVQTIINIINTTHQYTNTVLSIKCRIGVDEHDTYSWFKNFISQIFCHTPCRIFYVHARKCWLNGISPKDNRNIPQLKYEYLYQLKSEFPDIFIHLNGNIKVIQDIHKIYNLDGLMIGRAAVKNVFIFKQIEEYITQYNKEKYNVKENKENYHTRKNTTDIKNITDYTNITNYSSITDSNIDPKNTINCIDTINSNTDFIKEVFIKYIKSFNCNDRITNNLIQPIINLRYGMNRNKEYKNVLNNLVLKKSKISEILDIIDEYF
ncbi:tRNA dihydrouridine synthase [Hamiltosporidium tvaerminnensis]|uniref:tRNA dihydrouridine synthase n=1 Tax=Hamiltosporidium tvaerminnensis TaxID=1176355 RepID=A0A4Q9LY61_9MICR|nr:tRNA dihydrouridine synthase [Hamiltosporidium tvaerminnensis]